MDDLLADGNSVVMVDHDVAVLRHANHLIEIGPGSGADGGRVIAQGSVANVEANPASRIGPFLAGTAKVRVRTPVAPEHLFDEGAIALETDAIHTVHPLEARIPKGRLTCVTGVSGSGKTTLVLESLVAGLKASLAGTTLPGHALSVDAPGIARVDLVDATPIGVNVRSTVGTYSGVLDDLRRAFAALPDAKEQGLKAGRVLLQHRILALPHLRRHGANLPGRAVPPRRGHPLPRLPRQPLRAGGLRHPNGHRRRRRTVRQRRNGAQRGP